MPVKWSNEKIDQCINLYNSGFSIDKVSKILHTNRTIVRKYLKLNNVEIRPAIVFLPRNKNFSWKGGKTIDKTGYILILKPDHPFCNHSGYVREHRLVMEEFLGRILTEKEVVHHINGIKNDNRLENLELFSSNSEHLSHELKGKVPNWSEEGLKNIRNAKRSL